MKLGSFIILAVVGCTPTSDPPALTATVTLSIGDLDDPRYSFSRIEGITTGPDGRVYVLQHEDANIRVYDSTGTFVSMIGRRGMGPGEFALPTKMWWSDGFLWVADGTLSRSTRFDRDGRALETRPMTAPRVPLSLTSVDLLRDGSLLALERWVPGHPTADRDSTPLMRIAGSSVDTLMWVNVRNGSVLIGPSNGRFLQTRHPFADNDVHRISATRDTIVVARRRVASDPGRAELFWFDLAGEQVRHQQFDLPLVPVGPAIRDSIVDAVAAVVSKSSLADNLSSARELTRKALAIPSHYAPLGEVIVAKDGSIWVSRGQSQAGVDWLVIDPQGKIVGKVAIPSGMRLLHLAPPHAWGVRHDEMGVPFVVRLTIG